MILQIDRNEKYITLRDKYNIVKEWQNVNEIAQILPSIDKKELLQALSFHIPYNGYYWFEIRL